MKYTTIRITEETALKLNKLKEKLSDTYEDVILKLLKEEGKEKE